MKSLINYIKNQLFDCKMVFVQIHRFEQVKSLYRDD